MYSYTCAVMTDTILIIKGKQHLSNVDFAQIITYNNYYSKISSSLIPAIYIHYNSEGCIIIISPLIVEDTQN